MQCSALVVLAALVACLACEVCAQRGPSQEQVTKALLDLDRIYSKRLQSDGFSDPGAKGDDILKLKQAYKLLMLQDLDNRYKMINRPRYGKRSDSHLLDLVPSNADEALQMERGDSLLWPRFADRR